MTSKRIQKYIDANHKKIDGWFSKNSLKIIAEINKIQNAVNVSGSFCEIGVHHGRSFVLLSLLSQNHEVCLGIDLFENQKENIDSSGFGNKKILLNNLKINQCDLSRIKLISKNSLDVTHDEILNHTQNKIRFFSIDGGHTSEVVHNDIRLAESCLSVGGIILVDDYFDEKWPGVSEGTLKHLLSNKSKLIPFAIFDDKVLFTNSIEKHSKYISELLKLVPQFIVKETEYIGEKCLVIFSSQNSLKNYLRKTKIWQTIKSNNLGNKLRAIIK